MPPRVNKGTGKGKGKGKGNVSNGKPMKGGKGGKGNKPRGQMKLSDLFDSLDARRNAKKQMAKKTVVTGVAQRRNQVAQTQKEKRAEKVAAKRGTDNKKTTAATKKGAPQKKDAPKSAEDLDSEMAAYWFKVGKGEDPKKLSLDSELDSYWSAQKSDDAPVEETEVSADPEPSEIEVAVAEE